MIGKHSRGWIDLQLYAMLSVALFSGLLLLWTNTSWRKSLATFQPVLASLHQTRSDVVKGQMAVMRYLAGERDIRLPDVDAFFDQAIQRVADLTATETTVEDGLWAVGVMQDDLLALEAYARGIRRLQRLARQTLDASPAAASRFGLDLYAAFASLDKEAEALDTAMRQRMAAATGRQNRINTLLLIVWLAFLLLLGTSLSLAGLRRRRAEAAMVESEAKYRSLFDKATDVILLMDANSGCILDCNQAVRVEWGYARDELIGRDFSALALVESAHAPVAVHYPNGQRTESWEGRVHSRQGGMRNVAVKTSFFCLGGRDVRLEMYRDITERKRGELALAEREAMLRHLGDNLPDGMIFTLAMTPAGLRQYLYVSQGVERIFGLTAAAALADATCVLDTVIPEDRDTLIRAEQLSRRTLSAFDVVVRLHDRHSRTRWLQFRAASRPGAAGEVVFDGVAVDITALKRSEERLRQAKAKAEEVSRAKSEFLANISHEVRTPLNGVLAMLQLLKIAALDSVSTANVDTALTSARGLVQILSDILDFSLLDSGRLIIRDDCLQIRALAADIVRMLSVESSRKGIVTRLEVADDVPEWIRTDGARVRQILFNVVGNAVKFTERGEVCLRIELASRNEDALHLLFTVVDTGIGIPEKQLDAIFEPFTQIDGSPTRQHGGIGLGLGIVKRLVQLLDGHILVESRQRQGTTFSLTIGCHAAASPEKAVSPAVADPAVQRHTHVLVVEDEAINRMATVAMLKKLGYAAQSVEDGDKVIEVLSQHHFDVVLMDIQMPRVSGVEATKRIRLSRQPGVDPHIPVVALTAHAMAGDRERYLASGMDAYLSKPVDLAALNETILQVTRSGDEMTETLERRATG